MSVLHELLGPWQISIQGTEGRYNAVGMTCSRDQGSKPGASAAARSMARTGDTRGRSTVTGSSTGVRTALKSAVLSRRHAVPEQPLQVRLGRHYGATSRPSPIDGAVSMCRRSCSASIARPAEQAGIQYKQISPLAGSIPAWGSSDSVLMCRRSGALLDSGKPSWQFAQDDLSVLPD